MVKVFLKSWFVRLNQKSSLVMINCFSVLNHELLWSLTNFFRLILMSSHPGVWVIFILWLDQQCFQSKRSFFFSFFFSFSASGQEIGRGSRIYFTTNEMGQDYHYCKVNVRVSSQVKTRNINKLEHFRKIFKIFWTREKRQASHPKWKF